MRLRGFPSFDDGLARTIEWVVYERAHALLLHFLLAEAFNPPYLGGCQ